MVEKVDGVGGDNVVGGSNNLYYEKCNLICNGGADNGRGIDS